MLKVKAIRVNLGLSQEEFAKELDMPLATYQRKEQGKSPWLYREILTISEISDVDIGDISNEP